MSSKPIKARTDDWTSSDFWRAKAPELHIEDPAYIQSLTLLGLNDEMGARLRQAVKEEGYFQLSPPQWDLPIDLMARTLGQFAEEGLPLPLAFVYDEFWLIFIKLTKVVEAILGPGFKRLPDFWAWHVDPSKGESGWSPHRDKGFMSLRADGSPKSFTLWLPLTEANTHNGCMYMVPANRDPTYGTPNDKEWRFAYPDIRALPAAAGSIIGWNQAVMHWGSRSSPLANGPRVSLALEFQAGDVEPFNQPLMEPLTIPNFEMRPRLIAKQILQYQHMYPLADDARIFAEGLIRAPTAV
jgi:hypothetical protein